MTPPSTRFLAVLSLVGVIILGLVTITNSGGLTETASVGNTGTVVKQDQTAPTLTLTNPNGGATLRGIVSLTASAKDSVKVAGVQFMVDGVNQGGELATTPYTISWDTSNLTNGSSHTISVKARDAVGNYAVATVKVTVDNSGGGNGGSCPKGSGYSDGCAGSVGSMQFPTLLNGYTLRPPWNVAGVDYAVGVPAGQQLTDWTTFSHAGCSVDTTTHHWIRCDNQTGLDLNGIDFSTNGGGMLYLNNDTNTTVENSKFGGANIATQAYTIQMAGSSSGLTVKNNYLDTGGTSAFVAAICGPIVFEYNYVLHQQQQVIHVGNSCNSSIAYKYNFLDDAKIVGSGHMNYQQVQQNTIDSDVEFNTAHQISPKGAEGFQFYCVGTCTIHSPTLSYNTMIAIPSGGSKTMSYFMHGSGVDSNGHTTLTGTAIAQNNYFDISGAYSAFYPSSFAGWSLSSNYNMSDGSVFSNNP